MYENVIWDMATSVAPSIPVFMLVSLTFSWLHSLLFKD